MLEVTNNQTIESKKVNHLIEFIGLAEGAPTLEQETSTGVYVTVHTFTANEPEAVTIGPGVKYRVKTNGGKLWISYDEGVNFTVSQ